MTEEVQISSVEWCKHRHQQHDDDDDDDDGRALEGGSFRVMLDDGSPAESYDMIWLATGGDNDVDLYPVLARLRRELPLPVVNGLPVVDKHLNWRCECSVPSPEVTYTDPPDEPRLDDEEPPWMDTARRRIWVVGCLAALELGPDALNLMGARHGAVRVAKAIRSSVRSEKEPGASERGPPANTERNPSGQ